MSQGVAAETAAALPPMNQDAEESVIGALLLAGSGPLIDRVHNAGLEPGDFYSAFRGRAYRAALDLHAAGGPYDSITLAAELERRGHFDDVDEGRRRVHELAALTPALGPAVHWATIVVEQARRRRVERVAERALAAARGREGTADDIARQLVEDVADVVARVGVGQPLDGGLSHAQVLELEFPEERYLIDDLIPAGAVGTIAAVPESHKSWLAQAIAIRVGRGNGWVLGKQVCSRGRVGYLWQDDSTREEAKRVDAFEQVHPTSPDGSTDVTWFLNTGVQLPRDIPRLRATVEEHELVLLVLDSYYNFLPGVDLKDDVAEQIISLLKREICDATGCTVLVVDHMPWATDANRQRLRAYGGVFKNAATRFGIYIDAAGAKLHLEARGNNIKGIPRTLAYWDPGTLELKLVAKEEVEHDDLLQARTVSIIEWLEGNPGSHTSTAVRTAVGGKAGLTDEALEHLRSEGRVQDHGHHGGTWSGKRGAARYWIASIHAPYSDTEARPEQLGTGWDKVLDEGGEDGSERDLRPPTGDRSANREGGVRAGERDAPQSQGDSTARREPTLHTAPPDDPLEDLQSDDATEGRTLSRRGGTGWDVVPESTSPGTQDDYGPPPTEASPERGASSAGRSPVADPGEPRPGGWDVVTYDFGGDEA